jgi:DNA-3-methyladenine glycosylase II
LLVRFPEPFDFELSTERFRAFGPDPASIWGDGRVFRVLRGVEVAIEAARGGVRVELADPRAPAPTAVRKRTLTAVVPDVRRFLGGPFDLDGLARFAATADPVLADVVERLRGLRPPLAPDPFEALVTSITAQQVSLHAAFAIRARLVRTFGTAAFRAHAFPRREDLHAVSPSRLTELGFSRRKAEYVLALARSDLDLAGLAALPDEEVKARLVELPGIGEWTADWFLARHLGRPDAWPAGDLALRKAVSAFYLDGREGSIEEVRAFGERFSGHRNLAAHYLLAALRTHRVPAR